MNDPQVKYLLSLAAIRERAAKVAQVAQAGQLRHFDVHEARLNAVADLVVSVIERDYGPDRYHAIPPHGRWQHFDVGPVPRVDALLRQWVQEDPQGGQDPRERTRRLVDLFFVSVLLDAGAGDHWRYQEFGTEGVYERSEGIAVASLHMFKAGAFTATASSATPPALVDGKGLQDLTAQALIEGFQVSDENPMLGIESRAALLRKLGHSLLAHPDVFGEAGRPGNVVGKIDDDGPP